MNRRAAFLSPISFFVVVGFTSLAHAQEPKDDVRHDWSLGAGIGTVAIAPYSGLTSLGTLSLERALGDDFALIVSAGGTYQRVVGDFGDSKLAFGRLGAGTRAFLTRPAPVRGSAYLVVHGEYTHFQEHLVGVSGELGGSIDAMISEHVAFRVGAGLVRAAYHQHFSIHSQRSVVVGILPQAELRATF